MTATVIRPPTRSSSIPARVAAASLAMASLLAIAGFTVLGVVFQYPHILGEPTKDVLSLFSENQTSVTAWFLVLVVSAALMAPAGLALGRLAGGRLGRWIAIAGIGGTSVTQRCRPMTWTVGPSSRSLCERGAFTPLAPPVGCCTARGIATRQPRS